MSKQISPQEHQRQITAYAAEHPEYERYAAALKRVFEHACAISIPEAVVQARAKSVSSFAEKCVRKFDKYPDAVNQLTDLCGARLIVQTLDQVHAVKLFIERNFEVLERDDKASLLGDDKFGYRDMHYLVRLEPARARLIGFEDDEIAAIGSRIAEVQVAPSHSMPGPTSCTTADTRIRSSSPPKPSARRPCSRRSWRMATAALIGSRQRSTA